MPTNCEAFRQCRFSIFSYGLLRPARLLEHDFPIVSATPNPNSCISSIENNETFVLWNEKFCACHLCKFFFLLFLLTSYKFDKFLKKKIAVVGALFIENLWRNSLKIIFQNCWLYRWNISTGIYTWKIHFHVFPWISLISMNFFNVCKCAFKNLEGIFYQGAFVAANKITWESSTDLRPSIRERSSARKRLAGSDRSEQEAPSPAAIQSISSMKIIDGAW